MISTDVLIASGGTARALAAIFDYGLGHLNFTKDLVLFPFTFQVKAENFEPSATMLLSAAITVAR